MQISLRSHSFMHKFAFSMAVLAAVSMVGCNNKPAGDADSGAAASSGGKKRIMFLTNGDDPFWDTCRAGMDKAAEELKIGDAGFTHAMDKGSEFKVEKQISKLDQYATHTDIAGVAISPVDAGNRRLAKAMQRLRDKGVEVICVDSDMDRSKFRESRFAYLGTDNEVGGQELGKAAKALLPEGGTFATFVGIKTVKNAIDRIGGFSEGAGEGFENLDDKADEGDRNRAQENVKAVLNKHADIDALVGIWSYNAHAIVKVAEDRELIGKTKIVCFDAATQALTDMEQGKIDALVVQNPYQMGKLAVQLLKAIAEEDHDTIKTIYPAYDPVAQKFTGENGDVLNTELRVVVPNADSPVKAELFREDTKFFIYEDFKKWLNERRLNNS